MTACCCSSYPVTLMSSFSQGQWTQPLLLSQFNKQCVVYFMFHYMKLLHCWHYKNSSTHSDPKCNLPPVGCVQEVKVILMRQRWPSEGWWQTNTQTLHCPLQLDVLWLFPHGWLLDLHHICTCAVFTDLCEREGKRGGKTQEERKKRLCMIKEGGEKKTNDCVLYYLSSEDVVYIIYPRGGKKWRSYGLIKVTVH